MPRINFTVNLLVGGDARPLKRVYVEHISFGLRIPGSQLYITDDKGQVRDSQGNLGIDVGHGADKEIDVRIICHNSVIRVPNILGVFDHFKDFKVSDGATITITNNNSPDNFTSFKILNRCLEVYDRVFRNFQLFSGEFPLGRKNNLDDTRKSRHRIEVFFPSLITPNLPFVEPKSMHTGFPIIHIGNKYGNKVAADDDDIIPSELSHALHFSMLSEQQRHEITVKYGKFIVTDLIAGNQGTHNLKIDTDPLVAFVESFDHFSHRFERFIRLNHTLYGIKLSNAFILDQLQKPVLKGLGSGSVHEGFGVFNYTGNLENDVFNPEKEFYLTNGGRSATSIEGSIYAALFLDFARKSGVGLETVVDSYIRSKALSFGEYRTWIHGNLPNLSAKIDEVAATWTM